MNNNLIKKVAVGFFSLVIGAFIPMSASAAVSRFPNYERDANTFTGLPFSFNIWRHIDNGNGVHAFVGTFRGQEFRLAIEQLNDGGIRLLMGENVPMLRINVNDGTLRIDESGLNPFERLEISLNLRIALNFVGL